MSTRSQVQVFLNCYFGFVSAFLLFLCAITDYAPRAHVSAQRQIIYFWGSVIVLSLAMLIAWLARKPLGKGKFIALILPGAFVLAVLVGLVAVRH